MKKKDLFIKIGAVIVFCGIMFLIKNMSLFKSEITEIPKYSEKDYDLTVLKEELKEISELNTDIPELKKLIALKQ